MQPALRIFGGGSNRGDADSVISSVAVSIDTEDDRLRRQSCKAYFGIDGLRELRDRLVSKGYEVGLSPEGNQVKYDVRQKPWETIEAFLEEILDMRLRRLNADAGISGTVPSTRAEEEPNLQKEESAEAKQGEDGQQWLQDIPSIDEIEDERRKTLAQIAERQGQPAFRSRLLKVYQNKCSITGWEIPEVLEAAHIIPYRGEWGNVTQNGLLLRSDLHTLFDKGLITIGDDYRIIVHESLRGSPYGKIHGRPLRSPISEEHRPSRKALRWHREFHQARTVAGPYS